MVPKIVIVGGTYDRESGYPSGLALQFYRQLVHFAADTLGEKDIELIYRNGGNISRIRQILNYIQHEKPEIIFWFPCIDNAEEKQHNIKELSPKSILITSERNDNEKYSFQELLQHSLMLKANMSFEFARKRIPNSNDKMKFTMRVYDPLGCLYYDGTDIHDAVISCLKQLKNIKERIK